MPNSRPSSNLTPLVLVRTRGVIRITSRTLFALISDVARRTRLSILGSAAGEAPALR
jgi:hypothetical protein